MRRDAIISTGIIIGFVLIIVACTYYFFLGEFFWSPWPLSEKALKALKHGEMDSALMFANRAVQSRPEMEMTYNVRAKVHEARREFVEAIEDYTKAFSLGRNVSALTNRGRVHEKNGELGKAAGDYCEALQIDPDVRYIALGRVMGPRDYNTDRYPDAVPLLLNFIDETIKQDPDNPKLWKGKELILHYLRSNENNGNAKGKN